MAQQLFAAAAPQPTQANPPSFFPGSPIQVNQGSLFTTHGIFKRSDKKVKETVAADKKKRDLVQLSNGQTIDDSLLGNADDIEGLTYFGGTEFKQFLSDSGKSGAGLEDEIKEYDREPAEGEVMAIMSMCSFCDPEPFAAALILAWKSVKITMHHALQAKAQGGCADF